EKKQTSMSYPQGNTGPANGLNYNMPNGSQSLSSTPRATRPPPKASQMSSFGISNGSSRGSFGGYDDTNETNPSQQEEYPPQIYRAVYSNVPVYEMEVKGIAVMKRRSDSWLNATQILKVAGIVKARRTKTLEKEITAGKHEKVQGGYGKYQGTWVGYQRGVDLCREYNVEDIMRPLLEYDMTPSGTVKGDLDTPTKEQAMAAQRKRLYSGVESRGSSQPQQGTFFQNISRTAATAVTALSKARFESPSANSRRPSVARKPSQQGSQESQIAFSSQQSMYSMSDNGFASQQQRYLALDDHEEITEPPRKRVRSASNLGQPIGLPQEHSNLSMHEPTPTEPNDSFYQDIDMPPPPLDDGQRRGIVALAPPSTPGRFSKMRLLFTLFADKTTKDFTNHPAFKQLSGEDLEIPLDEYRNTPLHWAAMLARIPVVNMLLAHGACIDRVNSAGETALHKAVGTRNNLDYRSFPRLLQILSPTIDMVDYSGRTILHHIAVMAATGGGGHVSAKHYLECLLEFIIRHGGRSSSTNEDQAQNGSPVLSLGRFISEIVNVRDDQGDTALNIAGRARSILVPQLLEIGADPHIPNHTGLRPADYGVGVDMADGTAQSQQAGGRDDTFTDQLVKSKKEILHAAMTQVGSMVEEALSGMDRELTSSLNSKQEKFDHWHGKIRDSAKARQSEQKELDELKQKFSERVELDQRLKSLLQARERLLGTVKNTSGADIDTLKVVVMGDADKASGVDVTAFQALFSGTFDPSSGFSDQQIAFLTTLSPPDVLKRRIGLYQELTAETTAEIASLKAKNAILGEAYRRVVMACTKWSAEEVDNAAEGLARCVKELNDNPVPEDEAYELLMRDRGQDW
ncbi:hypothetical protein N7495_000906, partial [Penicillium taxi]|uniref:uncharacterized protein n=1 Tax=Penicillium taxi TaxID=168475 RepID=UPI0025457F22